METVFSPWNTHGLFVGSTLKIFKKEETEIILAKPKALILETFTEQTKSIV